MKLPSVTAFYTAYSFYWTGSISGISEKTPFLKAFELKSEYVLGLRTNCNSIKKTIHKPFVIFTSSLIRLFIENAVQCMLFGVEKHAEVEQMYDYQHSQ